MGFQNIGSLGGEPSKDSINYFLKLYFPQWLKTYNFENYSSYIFNSELNINGKISLDLFQDDPEKYSIEKKIATSLFVGAELVNLSHLIEWIEQAFQYVGKIEKNHLNFFGYKQRFEAYDSENVKFISDYKNNSFLSVQQFDSNVFNKIDSLTKEETLYFLTVMYLDLTNSQSFLSDKFVRLPKEKEKKEVSVKDFFPDLEIEQITNLQKEFSECRGIEMACFIHQVFKDGYLIIIKNSPKKSLSKFCTVFGGMTKSDYEAIRQLFKYDSYTLDNETYLIDYKTEGKINSALKVG